MLKIFIESACSGGTLSNDDRNLIFKKGKEQGISESEIQKMIDESLNNSNDEDLESGFLIEDDEDNSENNNDEDLESGFIIEDENTNDNNDVKIENKIEEKNTTQYPAPTFTNLSELDNQGAMSLVQKGKLHGKWIIIKRIKPKFKNNAKYKELFFKEFENAYHLDHPNIVRLLDRGEDAEGAYYTMEFIDGRPISEIIGKNGVKNERHIRKIFVQLLDGLTYVHKKQIFHRDLKPDNIYITFRGDNVKILDFGLAAADNFDDDLVKVGTPRYAAPEQMTKGNTIDQRADIYTLGLILLEMITGDVKDKTASTVSDANYKHIIQKCLAPNPNDRFDDCQDIHEALNTPIIKENKNDKPKDKDDKKKLPIVPIIIGVLVVALLVVGFLFKDKIFGGREDNNLLDKTTQINKCYTDGKLDSVVILYKESELIKDSLVFSIEDVEKIVEIKEKADSLFKNDNYARAKKYYEEIKDNFGDVTDPNSPIERISIINTFYENIVFEEYNKFRTEKNKKWGLFYDDKIIVDYLFNDIKIFDSYTHKMYEVIQVKKGDKWGCFYYTEGNIQFVKCEFKKVDMVVSGNHYWENATVLCKINEIEKIEKYMNE